MNPLDSGQSSNLKCYHCVWSYIVLFLFIARANANVMYLLWLFSSLMLKDVGSASVCPKCVSGRLNVAIALMWKGVVSASVFPKCVSGRLNVAIANVDLDKALAFIYL
jgi:hypothetical protein